MLFAYIHIPLCIKSQKVRYGLRVQRRFEDEHCVIVCEQIKTQRFCRNKIIIRKITLVLLRYFCNITNKGGAVETRQIFKMSHRVMFILAPMVSLTAALHAFP